MNAAEDSRIFVSYSHRGNGPKWKAALLQALQVFEQQHLLDVWQDGRIRVSSYWDDDIRQAMSRARLAVVLLTAEALESEYILNTEFPLLRERQQGDGLTVFPVVCEDCDWRAHDWLRATQAPNESNTLAQLGEAAKDRAFRKLGVDIAEELSRIALAELPKSGQPPPSDHVYLERFPIARGNSLREEKLIGREQELALLDLAYAQPHTAIISLVAWGGVGKTMLVQHWLQRLQREGWYSAERVYAWSFYSQGTKEDRQASEDSFLAHALNWFGVECEPTLSPWEKGRLLAEAVVQGRTLLVLDGIEPLQYPPGPMGGQLRAPGVLSLLKQLARKANSAQHCGLCLVTTREPLVDLADFQRREGSAWGSLLRVDLGNLTDEAGGALLHHAGANRAGAAEIKANDSDLLKASREVDGHALTLNLLGRFLARAHGGDIRRRDLVKFEEADRKEQGGTTFRMLAAFEEWFARSGEFGARQLAVLRMLGLFDRPADSGCIGALRQTPVIEGLTDPLFAIRSDTATGQLIAQPIVDEEWNTATSFLADFGLIVIQAGPDGMGCELDCHPLVREHFAFQLCKQHVGCWRSAHNRLYTHLKAATKSNPESLSELESLCRAVTHGCSAGVCSEAFQGVYWPRVLRGGKYYSTMTCGAYSMDLCTISAFFEEMWSRCAASLSLDVQTRALAIVGFDLRAIGRLNEAADVMKSVVQMRVNQGDLVNAAVGAGNLSDVELQLGKLPDALYTAKQSVALAEATRNWVLCMRRFSTLGAVRCQMGDLRAASGHFRQAEDIQATIQPQLPLLYSVSGYRYCDLLLVDTEHLAWRTTMLTERNLVSQPDFTNSCLELSQAVERRATQTLEWAKECLTTLDVGLDHITLGRVALFRLLFGDETARHSAREHINGGARSLRAAADVTCLEQGVLSLAWLHAVEGDTAGARADLDEAWDIAERGPMRLHMADIHLYRARLFFREKHYPWKSPQDDLVAAERLINECGYHRRDQELADAKSAILGRK